jgi:small subunit ribosomal protein S8
MVSTDPIADMFSRIRNAIAVRRGEITLPHSKIKEMVAKILVENGFLTSVSSEEIDERKILKVVINSEGSNAKISSISRLSKPGQRRYVKAGQMPIVKRGRGLVIVSTSSGVMTGGDAQAKGLGGELIGEVY